MKTVRHLVALIGVHMPRANQCTPSSTILETYSGFFWAAWLPTGWYYGKAEAKELRHFDTTMINGEQESTLSEGDGELGL
jgi:hypothetical protein